MLIIDSHCHLDFTDFDGDREQVIRNAKSHGVSSIIVPAVSQQHWSRTIRICKQHPQLQLALGLHPIFIEQHHDNHLTQLKQLISQHQPIAVGEIGLDFYTKELRQARDKQCHFFEQQLIIAKAFNLPAIIHNRKAHDECIALLNKHPLRGGIIHAFNGNLQQATKYIEMGFLLGFGGMLTYARSNKLHNLVKQLPLTSIALETDAPDMTVMQHRGERNSPEYLPLIAEKLARLTGNTMTDVAQITSNNIQQIF